MTTKLFQKHLFKGTQTLEINGDRVDIAIKAPFKKDPEQLSVMLTVLNPEPVINKSRLDFVSRVNGEALISLYLSNPDADTFNAFVTTLKQKALEEYNTFTGIGSATHSESVSANVFDEPDFTETDTDTRPNIRQDIHVGKVENAIHMLETHLNDTDIQPLIAALTALKDEPHSEEKRGHVLMVFNDLGFRQGAVLTYAPYVSILLSDNPFGDD